MDGPYDLDDASIEALLAGDGYAVDPVLADLLGGLRVTATARMPQVSADLAALMGGSAKHAALTSPSMTAGRMRSRLAKLGAAAATAIVATTGGLAVAGALPAPLQTAFSHAGFPSPPSGPSRQGAVPDTQPTTAAVDATTTTVSETPTSGQTNRGLIVSGAAHNDTNRGCTHGHAVAAVASRGKSNGQPCHNPSTSTASSTPPNNTHNSATDSTPHNGDGTNGNRSPDLSPSTRGGSPNNGGHHDGSKGSGNQGSGSRHDSSGGGR
jgi:hypothetical protein